MRIKDTGLSGDDKYSKLVGVYPTYPTPENIPSFGKNITMYNSLKKDYSNPTYKVPWLLEDRKPTDYFASWLCLEKNTEATISLKMKIKDKKALPTDLLISYDKTLCEISSSLGKGVENAKLDTHKNMHYTKIPIKKDEDYKLEDEITIKILSDITNTQTIKVLCDGKDAGFLKLYPNKVKKLDVVCVSVTSKRSSLGVIKGKTELKNYLKQSIINITTEDAGLNLIENKDGTPNVDLCLPSITNASSININGNIRGQSLRDYLDEKLKQEFPNLKPDGTSDGTGKYDKFLRLYFFNETAYLIYEGINLSTGGIGGPIGGGRGLMFKDISAADVAHEAMHAIALGHSFGTQESVSDTTPYLFEYKKTENIMDYAHLDSKDKYSTWKWQWDKLRNFNLLTE